MRKYDVATRLLEQKKRGLGVETSQWPDRPVSDQVELL